MDSFRDDPSDPRQPTDPQGGDPAGADPDGGPRRTEYVTEVGHYRRPLLGAPWIAAALVVPALLAALGLVGRPAPAGGSGPPGAPASAKAPANGASTAAAGVASPSEKPSTPTSASATPSAGSSPTAPATSQVPLLEIIRTGDTVTVSGRVLNAATGNSVVALLQAGYASGVTVVNKLTVDPNADPVDAGAFGALASALKNVGGVILGAESKSAVSVTGVAPTDKARKALLSALQKAFPDAKVTSSGLIVGDASKAPATCDATGNYVQAVTTLNRIQFSSGTTLTSASAAEIATIAAALKKCPALKVQVAGNSDSRGSDTVNKALSLQRANVVKNRLASLGVKSASITAVGNGEAKPIASNETSAGQLLNRRVDVNVT